MHLRRMSQKYVAELLSVTPRTIRDWHAEGFPRNEDGSYSGPDAVAWLLERRLRDDDGPDFDDQRQRLAAAQAEKVEMDNATRRGELADMREVERFWTDCISAARAKFLSIPTRIGARVPPDHRVEVVQIAKEIVYEGLRELSEYEPPQEKAAQ